ncbi:MAG: TraB/GumN family protein [Caulobacterales bacterium]
MIRALFASFVLLLAASCATAQPSGVIHPALFVVRDADSKIYLFGTVHVRRPGAAWGGPEAMAALAEADEVWTELEMSPAADAAASASVMRLGAAPASQPLSSRLSAEQNARLQGALALMGAPSSAVEYAKPWLAGLLLSVMPIVRAGYDPDSGVDRQIDAVADSAGKRARWFETSEEQLQFFASAPEELQIEMLMDSVDSAADTASDLSDLERAWERGDLRRLERDVIGETKRAYPELYDVLFKRRNSAWADVLMRELDGAGVDFVAVGAGHLIGDEGLVALFRARGVRVERVRPQEQ